MTYSRFARSRGDGDISGDDAPRLWLALLGVALFGLFFALLMVADCKRGVEALENSRTQS